MRRKRRRCSGNIIHASPLLRLCPGLTSVAGTSIASHQMSKGRSSPVTSRQPLTSGTPGHRFQWGGGRHLFDMTPLGSGGRDTPLPDPGHHLLSPCQQSSSRPLDYGLPPLATQKVTSHTRSTTNHYSCQRLAFVKCHPVNR